MRAATRLLALVSLAAASAAVVVPAPADAAGDSSSLPRFLESLHVGPAAEFRLAVVHPVYAPAPPAPASPVPAFAASGPVDALGVAPASKDGRSSARVDALSPGPLWLAPGDVLRLTDGDFAVRTDVVALPGAAAEASVVRVSAVPSDEKPAEEPRLVGRIPGPGLLWVMLNGAREREMVSTVADLAKEVGLKTSRRSPLDLRASEKLAPRIVEYRRRLEKLPRSPAAGRREVAGYALVLDGGFAAFEVFADAKRFADAWPSRLEGIAVEAAVLELENGILENDLADPNDPDRFTTAVKEAVLAIYGTTPQPVKVAGLGSVLPLRKDRDVGRAVVLDGGAPQHVLWLRDPAARRDRTTPDESAMDPGVIGRKLRPTEAEKRWLDRRRNPGGGSGGDE